MHRREIEDPIQQLVNAIDCDGKPALWWVVRWSEGGHDPVAAAWQRANTAYGMARVLEIVGHPMAQAALQILRAPMLFETTEHARARVDAIRRLVPVPPTLGEVLGARDRVLRFMLMSA